MSFSQKFQAMFTKQLNVGFNVGRGVNPKRRSLLKNTGTLAVSNALGSLVGLSAVSTFTEVSLAQAADINDSLGSNYKISKNQFAYDPNAQYPVKVIEVPFRTNAAGRQLMARIYRPVMPGSLSNYLTPCILDLHGGAWNAKDRLAEEPMDRSLAASGILVVAIDLTLAAEEPYPANVQDANFGVRWLKKNAHIWGGSSQRIGVYGSSSGGHVAELLGMRPNDPRYNAYPLEADKAGVDRAGVDKASIDASIAYIATRSPISNPFARYQNALNLKREKMILNHTNYFKPWESIHESNPQEMLDRAEPVQLLPLLIMQGELDDNMLPSIQEKFAVAYKAHGGVCDYQVFKGAEHEWVAKEGEQTTLARQYVKSFIAKQLN